MDFHLTTAQDLANAASITGLAIATSASIQYVTGGLDRAALCGYIALGMTLVGLANLYEAHYLMAALQILGSAVVGNTWRTTRGPEQVRGES